MKKVIATIAIAGSTLALAACGSSTQSEAGTSTPAQVQAGTSTPAQVQAETAWDSLPQSSRDDICEGYRLFGPEVTEDMAYDNIGDPEDVANFMRIVYREC